MIAIGAVAVLSPGLDSVATWPGGVCLFVWTFGTLAFSSEARLFAMLSFLRKWLFNRSQLKTDLQALKHLRYTFENRLLSLYVIIHQVRLAPVPHR